MKITARSSLPVGKEAPIFSEMIVRYSRWNMGGGVWKLDVGAKNRQYFWNGTGRRQLLL